MAVLHVVKRLCPTRWTVRTAAMGSIVEHYSAIMDTMHATGESDHQELAWLKGGGL